MSTESRKELLSDIAKISKDLDIEGLYIVLNNCYKERRRITESLACSGERPLLSLVRGGAAQ